MKKFKKVILTLMLVLASALALTGCERANTYRKFSNNGADLPKSHILDEISLKEAKRLVTKNVGSEEYIYIFIGNPASASSDARDKARVFNEQARQYKIETLYWLDSDLDTEDLTKAEIVLQMNDIDPEKGYLISFYNGVIQFDSSSRTCYEDEDGKAFTNAQLAYRCFLNLLSKN